MIEEDESVDEDVELPDLEEVTAPLFAWKLEWRFHPDNWKHRGL